MTCKVSDKNIIRKFLLKCKKFILILTEFLLKKLKLFEFFLLIIIWSNFNVFTSFLKNVH